MCDPFPCAASAHALIGPISTGVHAHAACRHLTLYSSVWLICACAPAPCTSRLHYARYTCHCTYHYHMLHTARRQCGSDAAGTTFARVLWQHTVPTAAHTAKSIACSEYCKTGNRGIGDVATQLKGAAVVRAFTSSAGECFEHLKFCTLFTVHLGQGNF